MARFQVFRSDDDSVLLLDIQANLLDSLRTRMVVPLYPITDMPWSIGKLNPRFDIDGETVVMATQRMASVGVEILDAFVTDLSNEGDAITAAIDFLFQGF